MRRARSTSVGTGLVVVVVLGICGGLLGELLGRYVPWLGRFATIGIEPPLTLDLYLLKVTLGIVFRLNFGAVIGALIGAVLVARS